MKKILLIIFAFAFTAYTFSSCEDFLDKSPQGEMTEEDIFTRFNQTEALINRLYFYVRSADRPLAWLRYISESPLCDEMESSSAENGWGNVWNDGGWEPNATLYDRIKSTTASGACQSFWPELYANIRRANIILEGIEMYNTPDKISEPGTLSKRIGEIYFLRAYLHYCVIRSYGECPYVDFAVDPNSLPQFERESVHTIIEKICADCDEAYARVPDQNAGENFGRVDKGAVLGLKAMARWIGATPLYNGSTLKNDTRNYAAEYRTYDASRWTAVRDAAAEVINFQVGGTPRYSLYEGSPRTSTTNYLGEDVMGGQVYSRLWEIFHQELMEPKKQEWMWFIWNDKSTGWFTDMYPPSASGAAREQPVQDQVDEYEVIINGYGYPIYALKQNHRNLYGNLITQADMDAAYDDENPYVNRDPRFYRDITFHGSTFKNVRIDLTGGVHSGNTLGASNSTTTGYFLRKFMCGYWSYGNSGSNVSAPPLYRITTMHLLYCEAVARSTGTNQEIYNMMNRIRERSFHAPMPPECATNTELMLDYIERERRVELFHEKTRFWSCRLYLEPTGDRESAKDVQWNSLEGSNDEKAQQYFAQYGAYPKTQHRVCGMRPVEDPAGKIVINGKNYKMERFWLEDRVFLEKHYLLPLPTEELQRANIAQNPNW